MQSGNNCRRRHMARFVGQSDLSRYRRRRFAACRVLPDAESVWSVSTPDVPFCAAARVATAVVLARRSEVGRRREIADSKCADIRRHSQSLWSPGASFEPEKSLRRPCWSRKLHAPGTRHVGDTRRLVIRNLSSKVASGDTATSLHRRANLVDIQLGPDPEPFRVWVDLGRPPIFIPTDGEGRPTVLAMHRCHDPDDLAVYDSSPGPDQLISDFRSHHASVLPSVPSIRSSARSGAEAIAKRLRVSAAARADGRGPRGLAN